jgi:hypothetical protein
MNRLIMLTLAATMPLAMARAQSNQPVDKVLKEPALKDVQAAQHGGVVTLTGSVDLLKSKLDAEANVSRVHGVRSVQDDIRVTGPTVSDIVLQSRLQHELHTRAISVQVHDGIATLDGREIDRLIAFAAITRTASTPGVRGIVDSLTIGNPVEARLGPMPYTISSLP